MIVSCYFLKTKPSLTLVLFTKYNLNQNETIGRSRSPFLVCILQELVQDISLLCYTGMPKK